MKTTAPGLRHMFGPFELHLDAHQLLRSGRPLRLRKQPFQVLRLLVENAGRVVTREELRRQLWPTNVLVDFDHGLNNAIATLRRVLEDTAESPVYIQTVPRIGYRFMLAVSEPAFLAPAVPSPGNLPISRGRSPIRVVSTVAAALLCAVLPAWNGPAWHSRDEGRFDRSAGRIVSTHDVEAYRLYLDASYLGGRPSQGNLQRAIGLFQQAISRDPSFAQAYAGLAEANLKLIHASPRTVEPAARKAIELNPTLGFPRLALSWADMMRGLWTDAADQLHKATEADPKSGEIRSLYAFHLAAAGYLHAALKEAEYAFDLTPAAPMPSIVLAQLYSAAGDDHTALKYADFAAGLGVSKESVPLVTAYSVANIRARHYDAAIQPLINQPGAHDFYQQRYVRLVKYEFLERPLASSVKRDRLDRILDDGRSGNRIADVVSAEFCTSGAFSAAAAGDNDAAYRLMNQCFDDMQEAGLRTLGSTIQPWLWSPELRDFRSDSRFSVVVARLGLVAYWQQDGPPDSCDLKDGKLTCH